MVVIGTKIYKPLEEDFILGEYGSKSPNNSPNTFSKYSELAQWCNSNNAMIVDRGDYYEAVPVPKPTEEEIEAQELAEAKAERAEAVSKIIVEVDGMKFDGDETAQTRMGRTISAAMALGVDLSTEKRTWVLADNTVAEPTIAQLAKALELAGNEQTRLWTVPYQSDSEEDTVAISSIGID